MDYILSRGVRKNKVSKMDIGLYSLKFQARRFFSWLLPFCENVNPNVLTLLILPIGLLTAISTYCAIKLQSNIFYYIFIASIVLRIFLGTFDGYLAEYYKKTSKEGEILNRLMPEMADMLYLIALAMSIPNMQLIFYMVFSLAWLTSFTGLIPMLVNKSIQSVGPVGQTDRLITFLLIMILCLVIKNQIWQLIILKSFIYWLVIGGVITVTIRLWRVFKNE